jgi:membrane associated rhomboid family serine protease
MFLPLRDDTPRVRYPGVTVALVVLNVLVYLYTITLAPWEQLAFDRAAGAVPWEIAHFADLVGHGHPRDLVPPPLTIYTSMFLHGDLFHLLGNMWFLWVFGQKLEGWMGHARYLLFYLVAGTAAAILQVAVSPQTTMPMIGASGAIAGVLGAYALTFPRARVRCLVFLLFFVTFVTLPAGVLLGLWFVGQFVSAGGASPGIAWFAHIGGFVTGLLLARLFVRPPRRWRIVYHPVS